MPRFKSRSSRNKAHEYSSDLATRPHRIRRSCKLCNQVKDTKNQHRFHGYGSFAETHISYCQKHACCAQNDSSCYSEAQKKRYRKKKTNKRKKRSR